MIRSVLAHDILSSWASYSTEGACRNERAACDGIAALQQEEAKVYSLQQLHVEREATANGRDERRASATRVFVQSDAAFDYPHARRGYLVDRDGGVLLSMPAAGFSFWFGLVPILFGLLLVLRRLTFHRTLRLDCDALLLPTGFLRVRTAWVPYNSIERVWQTNIPWMAVLCIATKNGKFEVLSGMLPDADSYLAVRDFLTSQANDHTD